MSEPQIAAHVGPWHAKVTFPNPDPTDGRAITSHHVVIASCDEEAQALALAEAADLAATQHRHTSIDPSTATVRAGRICG